MLSLNPGSRASGLKGVSNLLSERDWPAITKPARYMTHANNGNLLLSRMRFKSWWSSSPTNTFVIFTGNINFKEMHHLLVKG